MAPPPSLIFSSITSRLLFVLILILVVDDITSFKINNKAKGEAARPLYGIILNGPYPKPHYAKPPLYPQPYKPFRPVYRPPPPVPYSKPQTPYYPSQSPPYYAVPPPTPAVVPYRPSAPYNPPVTQTYPQPEAYRPPVTPAYQSTTSAPYRPPVRPPVSNPVRFPVPTTFDNKPWVPLPPTAASYVLDPAVQLNEVDGYPWTQELREVNSQEEEIRDKLPDLLFRDKLPSKSLAQQHAAENEINFSPNPELRI